MLLENTKAAMESGTHERNKNINFKNSISYNDLLVKNGKNLPKEFLENKNWLFAHPVKKFPSNLIGNPISYKDKNNHDTLKNRYKQNNKNMLYSYALDNTMVCIDLDACFDESGNVYVEFESMIANLMQSNVYMEYSVSMRGLHIFAGIDEWSTDLKQLDFRFKDYDNSKYSHLPNKSGVEIYSTNKAIAVTFNVYRGKTYTNVSKAETSIKPFYTAIEKLVNKIKERKEQVKSESYVSNISRNMNFNFDGNVFDRVKQQVTLADVFARYGISQGKLISCLSNGHQDKTPSMGVRNSNTSQGFFNCFGCGFSGNIFHAIMELENLSKFEALKYIIDTWNLDINIFEDVRVDAPGKKIPKTDMIKIAIERTLDKFDIEMVDEDWGVYLDDKGYHVKVYCPKCNTMTKKTNEISYVNVFKNNNDNWDCHIFNIKCNDDDHNEYNKEIRKYFKKVLPSKDQLKAVQTIEDLKKHFKGSPNETFFKKDTIAVVGTGGGKTYQSAMKTVKLLIENEDILPIFSTKENAMLNDLESEIIKVIDNSCPTRTALIQDLIDSNNIDRLSIYKLTSNASFSIEKLRYSTAIITNHSYFYNVGHKSGVNKRLQSIKQYCDTFGKTPVFIIDEAEDFNNKGIITIPLNKYLVARSNINGTKVLYDVTENCMYKSHNHKDEMPTEYALKVNTCSTKVVNGIEEYVIDKNGEIVLEDEFNSIVKNIVLEVSDTSRREKRKVAESLEAEYELIDCVSQIELNIDKLTTNPGDNTNLQNLLLNSEYVTLNEKIVSIDGTVLKTPEDLNSYCINRLNMKDVEYKAFKGELVQQSGMGSLFVKYLTLKQKNSIAMFDNINIYYLTGNNVKGGKLKVDTSLENMSSKEIKEIDFIHVEKDGAIDGFIIDFLSQFEETKLNPLMFLGLKQNVNKYFKDNHSRRTNEFVQWVTSDLSDTNIVPKFTIDTTKYGIKPTTATVTYLNGSESQGRNYSVTELLIINGMCNIAVSGRTYWDAEQSKICVKPIDVASIEKHRQAIGRILRGTSKYKAVVIVGNTSEYVESIIKSYAKFEFKCNYIKFDKNVNRKGLNSRAISDIAEYVELKAASRNRNEAVEVKALSPHGNVKNKEESHKVIYDFYIALRDEKLKIGIKVKQKDFYPILKEKFGISERTIKTIIKQYS